MSEIVEFVFYGIVIIAGFIGFTSWSKENNAETEWRLKQEANRDRSGDWERHRK